MTEAVLAAALTVSLHLALRLSPLLAAGSFNDDGVYIALGRSLAEGSGYRLIHLVGAPVAIKFPPALPAVLALAWAATGSLAGVHTVVGVLNPLLVGAAVTLLWWMGRRQLRIAPIPLAVFAIGPFMLDPVIQYLNLTLAEPEFLLGWVAVLALAPAISAAPSERPPPRGRLAALGAVLAITTLFRTVGVVLIVAVLATGAARRRWRSWAIVAAAALAPLVAWALLHARLVADGPISTLPDEAGYWQLLSLDTPGRLPAQLPFMLWSHAAAYTRSLAAYLLTPVPLGLVLVAAAAAAAVIGTRHLGRERAVVPLSVLGMLGAALLWPYLQERFVLIVLPVAGLLVAAGVDRAIGRTPARWRRGWLAALLLVTAAVGWRQAALREAAGAAFVTGDPPEPADFSPAWFLPVNSRFIYQVSAWVRDHTRPDDRLLVDAPAGIFLRTGRRSMQASPAQSDLAPPVFETPGRFLASHIRSDSITVVVVSWPGSGLAADVRAVADRCAGALTPWDADADGFPRYYRVAAARCLDAFLP